ncbi:helix-turn-helix domain-containing protein [Streptomyces collinus]|uniref:helix-turn-helix domain-containing protein n=1 Tax=Streptomyces collinus TaxID=42684 RepID=UPI001F377565|nr:helix-turn-helix domain-containing protein [Streptomyces collinus]UJA07081.1 PucR family transcriptional regulator [Streptomyces collinus]UJA18054.1 PucR family transcriptional regulator [Streptomyces collinus]
MASGTGTIGAAFDRAAPTARRVEQADEVLALHRAARTGGSQAALDYVADRGGTDALLVDARGVVLSAARRPRRATAEGIWKAVLCGVRELARRRAGSMAVDVQGHTVFLYPLDGPAGASAPVLVAMAPRPKAAGLVSLLANAAPVLGLCWKAETAERLRSRLDAADGRTREAVLQLLMNGQVAAARQVAGVLLPQLPDTIRIWVVERPRGLRGEVAARLRVGAPEAWVVPCTVYDEHLIVLAPTAEDGDDAEGPSPEHAHDAIAECWMGVSDAVALTDTAAAYAQAIHALAAARHRADRRACFASTPDLALAIGPDLADWAEHFLAPLRVHAARRPQDPGSTELLATAASWLRFSSGAADHLRIHRNTLSARLKHIARLLALDLDRLADQSVLALALRATTTARPAGPAPLGSEPPLRRLDDLLAMPAVTGWARNQFRPLTAATGPADLARTLTVWLHHDARVDATAAALSLSATAVRKRLARVEALLQRSLLRPPTARHDLWLAQRALGLTTPAACRHPDEAMSRTAEEATPIIVGHGKDL